MTTALGLLLVANVFMTFAWYAHLKNHAGAPLYYVILISWGLAFFEYCFQVPANRVGYKHMSLAQLKISQEVITLIVFAAFSYFYMREPFNKNFIYAALCMVGAVYFIFKK
ncbi:MAG TPA: DMT family protein [Bdellovibrionota bacterium]|nr:DMT family protein [Bdellovibrionota bacterium]